MFRLTGDRLLLDILRRWEVGGIAADIYSIWVLVHTNPINLHDRRENNVLKIDETEVRGHAQVNEDVLSGVVSRRTH